MVLLQNIYHEYQGEDFSKYLQDDDYTTSTTTLTRRVQKHKQHNQPKSQAVAPNRRYAVQNPKKSGIKDKITQAFTLTRSDRKKHEAPTSQPKTKIQNFSFMTSKMGMYASEEELNQYMTKDMETKSDIGGVKKSAEVPSWYKDTLSASTLRRAKNALDQKSFSSSVPNLTEAEQYKTLPNGDGVQNGRYRGESLSEFGADIKKKKKVNRFKFWKGLGKKGKKNKESSQNFEPECVDIKL